MSTNAENQKTKDLRGTVICLFDVDGTITDPRQVNLN